MHAFGLYRGEDQIGFCCFAHYSLKDRNLVHSNRVVVHPDYIGVGLGIKLATAAAAEMHRRGHRVWAKFTSPAMYKQRVGHPRWKFINQKQATSKKQNAPMGRVKSSVAGGSERRNAAKLWGVRYFWFEYRPDPAQVSAGDPAAPLIRKRRQARDPEQTVDNVATIVKEKTKALRTKLSKKMSNV